MGWLQGYPDKDEAQLTDAEMFNKLNLKKTSALLKGYSAWRTKLPTVRPFSPTRTPVHPLGPLSAPPDVYRVPSASAKHARWRRAQHRKEKTCIFLSFFDNCTTPHRLSGNTFYYTRTTARL
jgi:hypothetical protein